MQNGKKRENYKRYVFPILKKASIKSHVTMNLYGCNVFSSYRIAKARPGPQLGRVTHLCHGEGDAPHRGGAVQLAAAGDDLGQ